VYELLWRSEVPDAVAIDEAVELAKSLSTDESPRFVNGVLAKVLREHPKVS
ncbi:MAG: utilization substance B-like protein, partial [Jatrophihabitans sp.]|nr:utilization substance B-like protein [Jatrophihabitans sp.]